MSNKQDIEKLFEDEGVELPDIDGLDLVNIDLDAINEFATNDAKSLVSNIIEIYYNDEFMKAHPNLKRQIDAELESLRILLKMRKADEEAILTQQGNESIKVLVKPWQEA